MPRKILLIESDAPFAREMAAALEEKGFEAQVSGDGKEGLDLARDLHPSAIVLCVELPKMSGYSICNKLKKDDGLRSIPLVIISAEATPETFEQHKKLRTRAEDYLIKPFPPSELAQRLAALVGAPEVGGTEEEVVTLADVELEGLGTPEAPATAAVATPPRPAPLPLASIPPAPSPDEDEDLKLLDDAFESIAAGAPPRDKPATASPRPAPPAAGRPLDEGELDAASSSLPEVDEGSARAEIDALGEEADAALAALGADDEPAAGEALSPPPSPSPTARAGPAVRGASADALRAAGIPLLDAPPPSPSSSRQTLRVARDLVDGRRPATDRGSEAPDLRQKVAEAQSEAGRHEAEARAGKAKLEAIAATVTRLETDLKAARDEARRASERAAGAEKELAELRDRLDDAERAVVAKGAEAAEAAGRTEALERELEELRTEIVVARGEAEGARGEIDKRGGEMRRRIQELEAASAKNEERVVKAYQKIKGDEKLREKTRKALTIALQLLDERAPGDPEKDRSAARE
jgi:CheY-like chemotaxis protein/predicted  nucleic acid-binding Zn-ribbon protein